MADLGRFLETLAFTGGGMATGNIPGAMAQMGLLRQNRQSMAFDQELQRQKLEMLQAAAARKAKQAEAMQAIAPGVAKELYPTSPNVQMLLAQNPELLGDMVKQRAASAAPTAGMRQFEAFKAMPPEQQGQFLEYQRSMSPFAGAQAFMSPLGGKAEAWKNEAGESPSPALTAQQATQQGFTPSAKATEKQQDVAAFVQNAEVAEKMLGDLEGWTAAGTLAARNPVSRLVASEADRRASDFQLAWTMAVLRAESGAVISPAEARQQIQVYFEQPGDSPQQKADKAALRETKMKSMRQRAGKAYTPLPTTATPAAPQGQPAYGSEIDAEVESLMNKYLGP